MIVYGSTIAANTASYGGGITSANHTPDPGIGSSVVAGNTASTSFPAERDLRNASNDPFSLVGTDPGASNYTDPLPGSNIIGVDPQLGALGANGGPTKTMKPALTSPLLDKGVPFALTDKRGSPRPVDLPGIANAVPPGDGTDIGAVELTLAAATPPANPPPQNVTITGQRAAALKKCKKKKTAKARKKCKKKARKLPL
jgi:hypothetical protein